MTNTVDLAALTTPASPAAPATPGTVPGVRRHPLALPPLVVLVAWGSDPTCAAMASHRGRDHVRVHGYRLHAEVTSDTPRIRDAVLHTLATRRCLTRYVDYDQAWWLLPHHVVSPHLLERVRAELRQVWRERQESRRAWPTSARWLE